MTSRERVLASLRAEVVDRLPTYVSFTPLAAEQAAGWLGVAVEELPRVLGNDLLCLMLHDHVYDAGTTSFDIWGVGWDNAINDGFQVDVHPLADIAALATYRFPDPDDPRLYAGFAETIARNNGELAVFFGNSWCLWERFYLLRGYEQAMEDLACEPALVEDLLDRIVEIQLRIVRNVLALGIDIAHAGDDFGAQRGLLFSPDTWRRLVKPRYARYWGAIKQAGAWVSHHSCGDVRSILDDMAEIGLDILTPVQTQAMPPEELADRWGDRLAFWGGICTQHVLPYGTPDDVRAHITRCRTTLARHNRWLQSPSHDLTSDVPRENFFAMLEGMGIVVKVK